MPQLIGCTAVLAGTFAALIMIAGSHDTRAITAVLLVFAVLLSVPCARRWANQDCSEIHPSIVSLCLSYSKIIRSMYACNAS